MASEEIRRVSVCGLPLGLLGTLGVGERRGAEPDGFEDRCRLGGIEDPGDAELRIDLSPNISTCGMTGLM